MRKLISLGLAAAMVASLTACGSNSNSGTTTTAAGAAESTTAAAGNDSEAPASGEGFKVGVIGPLTGGAAAYGNAVKNGADLAVKEINAAGGVNGVMLELNAQDDEHDAQKSVNAYNTLKDWGAQMIVGSTTSGPCIAVAADRTFM